MDFFEERDPVETLFRLDPDLSVHTLDQGIVCSNGPCFSPDDGTFYVNDTWSGEIWAYDDDIETETRTNRRAFAKVDTSKGGAADGSTVDARSVRLRPVALL